MPQLSLKSFTLNDFDAVATQVNNESNGQWTLINSVTSKQASDVRRMWEEYLRTKALNGSMYAGSQICGEEDKDSTPEGQITQQKTTWVQLSILPASKALSVSSFSQELGLSQTQVQSISSTLASQEFLATPWTMMGVITLKYL
ncbi:hypothetical protein TREMEDRAFT_65292 [Tremella mesenterica DSM 1558]|uniref:uncharacterized protein n=1 Tax=Tremella mesenterica (strain ATCC 24925 / CBS 8224 / DSM 1558 / NBRC 9311 / NRRL Y-6157 / RJB 2259-6 / UBC 559-6) TaxID=578456 RepID=UPI00032D60AF|nr:uncharacterized protein TREMEDRAFT_65292 [Tremella mesenterica DSM 1558]EIW66439.1 hypothetical protein TREMEDRAFT_65292 [Tremella mesenterica DSM 1558]